MVYEIQAQKKKLAPKFDVQERDNHNAVWSHVSRAFG